MNISLNLEIKLRIKWNGAGNKLKKASNAHGIRCRLSHKEL